MFRNEVENTLWAGLDRNMSLCSGTNRNMSH